jgi:deoxyribonuclease IV
MIRLGPAGVGGEAAKGLLHIKEIGLDAVEFEFTHGVQMGNVRAKELGILAKKLGLGVSVHCPYFINLSSKEKDKVLASKKRILDSCERGHHLGAGDKVHIVFHAGFYGDLEHEECYQKIKAEVTLLKASIRENGWDNIILAPETTGKGSQFGDLDELLRLSKETGCSLTVDFAHIYARNNGNIDYPVVFAKLKKAGIKHIHCHFSGIEYTAKGEKRHIILDEGFFMPLAEQILKNDSDITIISESPITWEDSLKMKNVLERLRSKRWINQ